MSAAVEMHASRPGQCGAGGTQPCLPACAAPAQRRIKAQQRQAAGAAEQQQQVLQGGKGAGRFGSPLEHACVSLPMAAGSWRPPQLCAQQGGGPQRGGQPRRRTWSPCGAGRTASARALANSGCSQTASSWPSPSCAPAEATSSCSEAAVAAAAAGAPPGSRRPAATQA